MEAEFPIADDESSKSSVAEMPPAKKPLGQAIERRRKKNVLFNDKNTNKEDTTPSRAIWLLLINQRYAKQWEGCFQGWNPACQSPR